MKFIAYRNGQLHYPEKKGLIIKGYGDSQNTLGVFWDTMYMIIFTNRI